VESCGKFKEGHKTPEETATGDTLLVTDISLMNLEYMQDIVDAQKKEPESRLAYTFFLFSPQ